MSENILEGVHKGAREHQMNKKTFSLLMLFSTTKINLHTKLKQNTWKQQQSE